MDAARPEPLSEVDLYTSRTTKAVRGLILSGHFQPGDRINEADLAASLNISRGPLREALQRLASEGLVQRVAHRGSFIPEFGAVETIELYETREALEVMAARLAAQRADADDRVALRGFLEATRTALQEDGETHYPADMDFHERILALAGNRHLAHRCGEVHRQLYLTRSKSAYGPERAREAYDEHVAIVDAIQAGDPSSAEAAMRRHLQSGLSNVRKIYGLPE